eukprot:TRINITY_DN34906_c0_g1_i1.p1 TRINITY_DN34906_c0_g1~~TRINITY_DN34906_c0_g1_i1.p1  ORF type:complete len:323 (-),score=62.27 TRINITY_DN34906_c0_g1_i1:216-1184(-)
MAPIGSLGPKPRVGAMPAGGGAGPGPGPGSNLQFFDGGLGQPGGGVQAPQPGAGGVMPPQPMSQPAAQPVQQPVQQPAFQQQPLQPAQPQGAMGSPMQPQPVAFQQPGGMQPGAPPSGQMGGAPMQPGSFPQPDAMQRSPTMQQASCDDDFENEPPLLEELGVNVGNIVLRMKGIAFFAKVDEAVLRDSDLSGPAIIVGALCLCLLLRGRLILGYVYGFSAYGCFGMWGIINVMSQRGGIDLYSTGSILLYGLIPIVIVALISVVLNLNSSAGAVVATLCIIWASAASSRFFAYGFLRPEQKWLVAYPVCLFYVCFCLLAVF